MQTLRSAASRGHAEHGWLDTWHSFSFADYYDPQHMHFGHLRVLNDDRIAAARGFGMHPHRDMEIITYMLSGQLQHRDSMGNGSIIRAGEVQRMSAGSGVTHSEVNASTTETAHLIQIWIFPDQKNIKPEYEQYAIPAEEKRNTLRVIAAHASEREQHPAPVLGLHQDARLYAGEFDAHEPYEISLQMQRRYYLHVARGSINANGQMLNAGDALQLQEEKQLQLANGQQADVLLFDLA